MSKRELLLEVCRTFADTAPDEVVFPEPYLPYVPTPWNGILVLAESQNLSDPSGGHVRRLDQMTPEERMTRLPGPDCIGVGPWDNGIVKLALKAMMPDVDIDEIAVGNAIPWSRRDRARKNANPTKGMRSKASDFWRELLKVWQPGPRHLVVLGNMAAETIRGAGISESRLKLRLPSPNAIRRICGMFDRDDLLGRFPEVGRAAKVLGMEKPSLEYVFYACHAVSLGKHWFNSKT